MNINCQAYVLFARGGQIFGKCELSQLNETDTTESRVSRCLMAIPELSTDELQRPHWVTPQWAKARAVAAVAGQASYTALGYTAMG